VYCVASFVFVRHGVLLTFVAPEVVLLLCSCFQGAKEILNQLVLKAWDSFSSWREGDDCPFLASGPFDAVYTWAPFWSVRHGVVVTDVTPEGVLLLCSFFQGSKKVLYQWVLKCGHGLCSCREGDELREPDGLVAGVGPVVAVVGHGLGRANVDAVGLQLGENTVGQEFLYRMCCPSKRLFGSAHGVLAAVVTPGGMCTVHRCRTC
jgi:hypothetical protein